MIYARDPSEDAKHEAAHVVVGVALGLRLRRATIEIHEDAAQYWQGEVDFAHHHIRTPRREALALMFAAGIAWDRSRGLSPDFSKVDWKLCRELCSSKRGVETMVTASAAILAGRQNAHRLVTEALISSDVTPRNIAALCRGERPGD